MTVKPPATCHRQSSTPRSTHSLLTRARASAGGSVRRLPRHVLSEPSHASHALPLVPIRSRWCHTAASALCCCATSKGNRSHAQKSSQGGREATISCSIFQKASSSMAGGRLMDRHQWHAGSWDGPRETRGTRAQAERCTQWRKPASVRVTSLPPDEAFLGQETH